MSTSMQCPKCGAIAVRVSRVPPTVHEAGAEWKTRAVCENCQEYVEWYEPLGKQ